MKPDKKDIIEIFENAISWVVVLAMFVYGAAKPVQFKGAAQVDKVVSEMTGMELMWAFYGYSPSFAIVLGVLEITGGLLILIKKTRLLGCFFTSTILVNIIVQDIFFEVHRGALKAAILYQLLILIILWIHKKQVLQSFKGLLVYSQKSELRTKKWLKWVAAGVFFAVFRIAEYYITIW